MAHVDQQLDHREKIFVEEYLKTLSPHAAALAAGYSKTMANTKAYSWVCDSKIKPHVYRRIKESLDERNARTQAEADQVIEELKRIAFGDVRSLMSWKGNSLMIKDSTTLSPEQASMVSGVVLRKSKAGNALELKFNDKLAALDKLMRHIGMFKDNINVTKTVSISDEDREILQRIGVSVDD